MMMMCGGCRGCLGDTRPPCPAATEAARVCVGDKNEMRPAHPPKPTNPLHHPSRSLIISQSSLAWIQEFMDTGDIAEAHAPKPPPAPAKEGTGALAFA